MDLPTHTDVLVVGGGIHGVGTAQAAAAAGYHVVLLEKTRLGDGTSSRSSKLIHGGLRYLESGQIRLVWESLSERELLVRIAPGLVHRLPFYIPVYPNTTRRPMVLRAGLTLYALLAGLRAGTRYRRVRRSEWNDLDGLRCDQAQAIFQYWDAQTNDRLLTQSVMRSAEKMGAVRLEGAELQRADVRSDGCQAWFNLEGQEQSIHSRVIVNATGPWVNRVLTRVTPKPELAEIDLVQGTHLELPGTIQRGCYYVEAPQDGRAVFVMPWGERTMLGTTEKVYTGPPDEVQPTEDEIQYLLTVYRHYFPTRSTEILDAWAGLRVLPKAQSSAFRRSRETILMTNSGSQPRLLSIVGGKLTGYRVAADKVMRKLTRTLQHRARVANTRQLPLT